MSLRPLPRTSSFFHAAPIQLGKGSIVLPGNWGRIVRHFGQQHLLWPRELSFEQVRSQEFPDRPSRLESAFCAPTLEGLTIYLEKFAKPQIPMELYEVEIVDASAATHIADHGWLESHVPMAFDERARRYWQGDWINWTDLPAGTKTAEVLTLSPLRIVGRVP